jgi:succinate dehydrogenase / fumarate reductase cytochrome b subunit
MANIFNYLKSTILSKVVMAVTGVILVGYILVHALGNMQIYIGQDAFNTYSHFLHSTGELLWVARLVLLLALVLHIITSIRLKILNLGAKPDKYAVKGYVKSTFSSRTMIWTGVLIFLFVSYHVAHLTLGVTNPEHANKVDLFSRKANVYVADGSGKYTFDDKTYNKAVGIEVFYDRTDIYKSLVLGFRVPYIAILYMLFVILVGFHLNHAMQSAFQTLGWNNPKYFDKLVNGSRTLSILIVLMLISIPINVLLGIIGRGI